MIEEQIVEPKIRNFIYEKFPLAGKRRLDGQASLLESGIVDSIGILDIVSFVEQNFGITVVDDDLVPENLGSISAIADFVQRKLAGAMQEQTAPIAIEARK